MKAPTCTLFHSLSGHSSMEGFSCTSEPNWKCFRHYKAIINIQISVWQRTAEIFFRNLICTKSISTTHLTLTHPTEYQKLSLNKFIAFLIAEHKVKE